jgi:hypothetical protein
VKKGKERPFIFLCPLQKHSIVSFLFFTSFWLICHSISGQNIVFSRSDTIRSHIHQFDSTVTVASLIVPKGIQFEVLNEYPLLIRIPVTVELPVPIRYQPLSPYLLVYPGTRDLKQYDSKDLTINKTQKPESNGFEGILDDYPGLYRSGSITRGFTVGNRQNLFVNSALNLQLQGQISQEVQLTASITDQNIPYQPEGNTQQLRDFDNVYISLTGPKTRLKAGDIKIQNSSSPYFLRYNKNQQGFQIEDKRNFGENWQSESSVGVGVAKGRFASIKLSTIEGINGPYKLRGAQNERFIIVIANSEKVFLDGKPLTRGFNHDYVIDYNLGEITFTSRVLLTRFSRIRVDFEYTNLTYQRSNLSLSQRLSNDRHFIFLEYFRAVDDPNRALQFELSDSLQTILNQTSNIENNQLLIAQERPVTDTQPGNYYIKKDTVIVGETFSVYQYASEGDDLLRVSFTETGEGDYIISNQNAYGRIFKFIAPVDGKSQGTFQAAIQVMLPTAQEMMNVGYQVKLTDGLSYEQQLAVSQQDMQHRMKPSLEVMLLEAD